MSQKIFQTIPSSIKFAEGEKISEVSDIQLMKTGKFTYYFEDDMVVDKMCFERMIFNFQNKVRGIDLAVDYGHNAWDKAAGWIKELYTKEDGDQLWAKIQWTPDGMKSLEEKNFRYISAEFDYDYIDQESKVHYGPTLFGAGLTNRPFLKNMEPLIELSDKNKENKMSAEELKKLSENFKQLSEKVESLEKSNQEKDEQIKKLSEVESNRKEDKQKEEKTVAFNEMLKQGKVVEAQREAFMSGDTKKFAELSQPIKFDNLGHSEDKEVKEEKVEDLTPEQAEEKVLEKAQEFSKKENVSLSEAIKSVLRTNKQLAEKYRSKFE